MILQTKISRRLCSVAKDVLRWVYRLSIPDDFSLFANKSHDLRKLYSACQSPAKDLKTIALCGQRCFITYSFDETVLSVTSWEQQTHFYSLAKDFS